MNLNVSDRPASNAADLALATTVRPRRVAISRAAGVRPSATVRRRSELNDDGNIATGFVFATATASLVWAVMGAMVWAFM